MRRFAWIIVSTFLLLVIAALVWSFTNLDRGVSYAQ
jgi:hypothetical protein